MRYIRCINYVARVLLLRLGARLKTHLVDSFYNITLYLKKVYLVYTVNASTGTKSRLNFLSNTSHLGHDKSITKFHLKIRIFIIYKRIQIGALQHFNAVKRK